MCDRHRWQNQISHSSLSTLRKNLMSNQEFKGLGEVPALDVCITDFSLSIPSPKSIHQVLKREPSNSKNVLSNISFQMRPGQVIAIMGSSGISAFAFRFRFMYRIWKDNSAECFGG